MQEMMKKSALSMCEGELSEKEFEKTYFSSYGNHFWVIEESGGSVYGCVGVKRMTADTAELVRMAVNPSIRGQGLGNLLVKELNDFCLSTGVLQVHLSTANPRAGNFYTKVGYVNLEPADSRVMRMVKYIGERVIRRVAIVGGTHGKRMFVFVIIRPVISAIKITIFICNIHNYYQYLILLCQVMSE
jgi:N-acetylglutamate synthase-like GNAT family acetyltransferase